MKKLKKLALGLLALAVMVGSGVPAMTAPASAATTGKEVTVYFQNSKNWSSVYAYLWHGSGPLTGMGAWPGQKMTKVAGTDNWYQIKFTPSTTFNAIFTNNNGNQTTDHTPKDLTSDKTAYWFVPTDKAQTGGGYGAKGVAVTLYTEAQSGFPGAAAAGDTGKSGGKTDNTAPAKDATPKTGDNGAGAVAVAAVAVVSAVGMGVVLGRKKKAV